MSVEIFMVARNQKEEGSEKMQIADLHDGVDTEVRNLPYNENRAKKGGS